MALPKILLYLLITSAICLRVLEAQSACPQNCPDLKPPGQPYECPQIAADGICGSRITARGTYCACSCKTCPELAQPSPSPSPPPITNKDGWIYINATKVGTVPTPPPPFNSRKLLQAKAQAKAFADQCEHGRRSGACTSAKATASSFNLISGNTFASASSSFVSGGSTTSFQTSFQTPQLSVAAPAQKVTAKITSTTTELGLAVGGSRGIDTFRRNIDNNKLPEQSDITYEGIFNDYFFDISDDKTCNDVFCAKYSGAISSDPLYPDAAKELYIAVGLETGVKYQQFERNDLDLVIVLDVSGSMDSTFGNFSGMTASEKKLKKIDVAKDAIKNVLKHLNSGDRLAIVTFADDAKTVLELRTMDSNGKDDATVMVNSIAIDGWTNLEKGLNLATSLMTKDSRENRMIVITDANANRGEYSSEGLANLIDGYAKRSDPIYTTLIGVGLDFNTELTDRMLQTRGANYFSVYSPKELQKKLDEEFDFMVTPLVYDLKLEIDQKSLVGDNGWKILKAYGVPDKDGGVATNGTVLSINTLFPSPKSAEGVKGGIVLLQVKPKTNSPNPLYIKVSYADRNFAKYQGSDQITFFSNLKEEFYGTNAIRKAILLSRYVDMMRDWINNANGELEVSLFYGNEFLLFATYVNNQKQIIKDSSLERETAILKKLIGLSA